MGRPEWVTTVDPFLEPGVTALASWPAPGSRDLLGATMHSFRTVGFAAVILVTACSGNDLDPISRPPKSGSGGASATTTGGGAGTTVVGAGGTGVIGVPDSGMGAGGGPACASGPNDDKDQDGYTPANGDCNDCDPNSNPGAFDVPGNMIDEDCSGTPDDEAASCEDGLAENGDAVAAAKAIGICRTATPGAVGKARTWGLVSARWVFPDGTTTSLGPTDA